jgi:hypothetical protein
MAFVERPQLIDLLLDNMKRRSIGNTETRTTFLKANVSGGSSNQARHCVTIVVLWMGFRDILVNRSPEDLTSDMLILILQSQYHAKERN